MFLTATVTFHLIAAIQTVNISIAAPADGDAMAVFALKLITVALHVAAVLEKKGDCFHYRLYFFKFRGGMLMRNGCDTSSEPSAQSWSPSHFQRPAMQRPFVQENSLSEHWRGTENREKTA